VSWTSRGLIQDVSKLVDICRQSLVFKDLSSLGLCLRTIRDDLEVQVRFLCSTHLARVVDDILSMKYNFWKIWTWFVSCAQVIRLKNRMDPDFDSAISAGKSQISSDCSLKNRSFTLTIPSNGAVAVMKLIWRKQRLGVSNRKCPQDIAMFASISEFSRRQRRNSE
jgi:hypothetical protein